MRRQIITCLISAAALLVASLAPAAAEPQLDHPVFIEGGVLAGSTNGISFAPDGTLYIANVFGATITQIDPESGDILSRLTAADGVLFPDDVIVAGDGTIYWTEIALGSVFKKPPGQPAFPLIPIPGGLNSANPLTLSDDGRLFAAGCYGGADNSFVEIDPVNGGIINVLFGPVEDCASNGMSWYDGYLYSPQPFQDEIWRVDPNTGATTPVTTGWSVPIGTAFDSLGNLYSLAQGVGEVVRIDINNADTANNRTVVAEIPVGWADNIAINDEDRIFISSSTDSTIAEVLDNGELRTVVPGQFQMTLGVDPIGDTLYTTNSSQIVGFDRRTGEQTSVFRAPFGFGFPFTLSSIAWGDNLVLMSSFNGDIVIWDPVNNVPLHSGLLPGPVDAQPFQGDLIVTTVSGDIFRVADDLSVLGVVANVPGVTGIDAKGGDVFVANQVAGTILQVIDDGVDLAAPVEVIDGLAGPEGIDFRHNRMYIVEGASDTLTSVHMKSGKRKTIAADLGFQAPTLPDFFPYGYLNNVAVAGSDIYVNADRANVIHQFGRGHGRHHLGDIVEELLELNAETSRYDILIEAVLFAADNGVDLITPLSTIDDLTLFAPTDFAFVKLARELTGDDTIKQNTAFGVIVDILVDVGGGTEGAVELLVDALSYHVAPVFINTRDRNKGPGEWEMLNGDIMYVRGFTVADTAHRTGKIFKGRTENASNGRIYTINIVAMPSSLTNP